MTIRQIDYKDETEVCMTVAEEDFRIIKNSLRANINLPSSAKEVRIRLPGKSRQEDDDCRHGDFSSLFGAQTLLSEKSTSSAAKSITESSIRECLREEGLYEGSRKNFDCDAVSTGSSKSLTISYGQKWNLRGELRGSENF